MTVSRLLVWPDCAFAHYDKELGIYVSWMVMDEHCAVIMVMWVHRPAAKQILNFFAGSVCPCLTLVNCALYFSVC